jgi:hypothetical protein
MSLWANLKALGIFLSRRAVRGERGAVVRGGNGCMACGEALGFPWNG